MSQHDFNIANQGFPAFRSDLNDALSALVSSSSGASAPATTYANQFWYDTTNDLLKMRDEANENWITLGTLDQVAKTFTVAFPTASIASQAEAEAGTVSNKLMTPQRVAQAIDAQAAGFAVDVQEFTSSGTWTMPANAKLVYVEIWGGGGGGGSGRRGLNTSGVGGGGGGGGAAGVFKQFRATELAATVAVTIGAGGAGGASVAVDSTNGNNGSSGGDSTFNTYLKGKGGGFGSGGSSVTRNGGEGSRWSELGENHLNTSTGHPPSYGGRQVDYGNGYSYNLFGGAAGGHSLPGPSGGGGGGGDIAKPGTGCAGGGGGGAFSNTSLGLAGIGGVRWGTNIPAAPLYTGAGLGVNGAAGSAFGDGGGGGGHGRTATAGNGGAGNYGAGGGGGGASANGYTSGAGGAGGNGFCRVTTYY